MACDQCLFQMDTQSELSGFSARSQPTLTRFSVHCSLFTFYCSRGTITVPRGLRPRVRPRHDRAILASPPSAVFDERGPKHDPAVPAAAACSPDRKVREVEARGRAISSAGATGKGETIGDSIFGPNQWLYRTANGDIQFLSVSWALPLFRRRWRGFPCLSKKSGHSGLSARAACLGRWRGRAAGVSDPIPWIGWIQRAASGGRGLLIGSKAEAGASKPARGLPITRTQRQDGTRPESKAAMTIIITN